MAISAPDDTGPTSGRFRHRLKLGSWRAGQVNAVLAIIQVAITVQGASRGEDYITPRPAGTPISQSLSFIERSGSITLYGWAFMLGAGLVLTGLYGGWTRPMVAGHGLLFGLYITLSWGLFNTVPAARPLMAMLGGAVLAGGLFVGLTRWRARNWLRFWLAMVWTAVGGWGCGLSLGYDFRSATGLMVGAGAHLAIGIGLAVLTEKDREHPWLRKAGRWLADVLPWWATQGGRARSGGR